MLIKYGLVNIEWQGQQFSLLPSFANMEKIGSPSQIIDYVKLLSDTKAPWYVIRRVAEKIVEACATTELPEKLTGAMTLNQWRKEIAIRPSDNGMTTEQLVILAGHLIKHGIIGDTDYRAKSKDGDNAPLKTFEASEFVETAVLAFDISHEEASRMTMTQFIRQMRAKYPDMFEDASDKQQANMLELAKQYGMLN